MRRILLALAAVLAIAAVAGCGSSSSSSTSTASSSSTGSTPSSSSSSTSTASGSGGVGPSTPAGQPVHVSMKSLAFLPSTVHAKVGQTVSWSNDDTPPHNVTYVGGPKFTSSPLMNPGATFHIKLTSAGTIQYYCSIHPFMKGTIVVSP